MGFHESVKIEDSFTAKVEKVVYITFYREFYKHFAKEKHSDDDIILAGMLLHLTFESLVTYTIRLFINTAYHRKDDSIKLSWQNNFETGNLEKKIQFLRNALLRQDDHILAALNELELFNKQKLAPLRNKIVHGHEMSETFFQDGNSKKTKLAGLASHQNIFSLHSEFERQVSVFLDLFKEAKIPDGVVLSPDFIEKDLIGGTKRNLEFAVSEEKEISIFT